MGAPPLGWSACTWSEDRVIGLAGCLPRARRSAPGGTASMPHQRPLQCSIAGQRTVVLERETGVSRAGTTYSAVEVCYRLDGQSAPVAGWSWRDGADSVTCP